MAISNAIALLLLVPCLSVVQAFRSPDQQQVASDVRIVTNNGDMHLVVPAGGDVFITSDPEGAESQPRQVSILAQRADDAQAMANATATLVASIDAASGRAEAATNDLEIDLRASLDQLVDELAGETRRNVTALASQATTDLAELRALKSALLPAKPGAYALTAKAFAVRVAYEVLTSAANPLNLTFYITTANTANADISEWQQQTMSAPMRDASIVVGFGLLSPETDYAIRVRGTSAVGDGQLSDVQNFRTIVADGAEIISCSNQGPINCAAGQTCTVCTTSIAIGARSFMYAAATGAYQVTSSSRMAMGISFNNDNDDPYAPANQNKANGIGGSNSLEQVHTARSSPELAPGTHTITIRLRCMGGASCSMNYVGMQAVWLYQKSGMSSASCAASALTIPVGQNTRICQIRYASPRAVALATVMGGINTGHLYMVPSFNNDGRGQGANQRFNPAHSYSRGWDNYGSGRARIMNAGTKTTEAYTQHGNGQLRYAGVSQLIIPTDGNRNQFFRCNRGWGGSCTSQSGCSQCSVDFTVPYDVIAMAEFTGHYRTNDWCTGMIMFDNDETTWYGSGDDMPDKGRVMASHGKSTQWENFSTKRFKRLSAGRHTASVWIRGKSGRNCWLNGMGMDGFWTKAA